MIKRKPRRQYAGGAFSFRLSATIVRASFSTTLPKHTCGLHSLQVVIAAVSIAAKILTLPYPRRSPSYQLARIQANVQHRRAVRAQVRRQALRHVLVQQQAHQDAACSTMLSRYAAYSGQARTCAAPITGKSSAMSAALMPLASISSTSATVVCVPFTTDLPKCTSGFNSMRAVISAVSTAAKISVAPNWRGPGGRLLNSTALWVVRRGTLLRRRAVPVARLRLA